MFRENAIINVEFSDLHSTDNGGAICNTYNKPLYVEESVFEFCESETNGGAIFKEKPYLYVTKCLFYRVHCSREINNEGGNVIDIRSSSIMFNLSSIAQCWIDVHTGDSSIICNSCNDMNFKNINISGNIYWL